MTALEGVTAMDQRDVAGDSLHSERIPGSKCEHRTCMSKKGIKSYSMSKESDATKFISLPGH